MIVTDTANVIKVRKSNEKNTIPDFAKAVGIYLSQYFANMKEFCLMDTALLTDDQNVT